MNIKRQHVMLWLLATAISVGGCSCNKPAPTAPPAPTPAPAPAFPALPTKAQPKLPTIKLWLGAEEMITEMALTPVQEQTGMMFRTNMAENEGMIFVEPYPQQASFWMMNCPLSLSVAFMDSDGVIKEIHKLESHNTNSVVSTAGNIRFALETPEGWFDRHNIKPGTVVRTERGSLSNTFLRRQ